MNRTAARINSKAGLAADPKGGGTLQDGCGTAGKGKLDESMGKDVGFVLVCHRLLRRRLMVEEVGPGKIGKPHGRRRCSVGLFDVSWRLPA